MALAQSALFIVQVISAAPSQLPLWAQAATVSAWFSVVSTKNTQINPTPTPAGSTGPPSKINAWGSLGFEVSAMRFWCAGGGHTNYSGNEVHSISFLSATPTWVVRRDPTTAAQVTASVQVYLDGRPNMGHTYYNGYFIQSRNRFVQHCMNAVWNPDGGVAYNNLYMFDATANDWVSAAAWPSVGAGNFVPESPKCMDSRENIFAINTDGLLMKMVCSAGAGSSPVAVTIGNTFFGFETGRPLCWDPNRNRLLRAGISADSGWYTVNVSTAAISAVALTGFVSFSPANNALTFDTIGDQFICVDNQMRIAAIHPTTFLTTRLSIAGNQPAAMSLGTGVLPIYNRAVFVSALKGLLVINDANQNAHYVKLYNV